MKKNSKLHTYNTNYKQFSDEEQKICNFVHNYHPTIS